MRLKHFVWTLLFCGVGFLLDAKLVKACCQGMCNTHDDCEFENTVTEVSPLFSDCSGQTLIECEEGEAEAYVAETYSTWSPPGSPNTMCTNSCEKEGSGGLVTETKSVWCGVCSEVELTPTPQGGDDGGGGGGGGERV